MDYDRRVRTAANDPKFLAAKPAQVDEALGEAYRTLVSFKMGMDQMEEIPKDLQPIYDQAGKAISVLVAARQETYQLRMMVRRAVR